MDPAIRDLFYELFVIIKDPKSGEKQLDLGVKIALEIQNKLKNDPQYATQHLPDLEAAKWRVDQKVERALLSKFFSEQAQRLMKNRRLLQSLREKKVANVGTEQNA
ncbi:hypothetical protein LTR10_021108 [Elasticomyces elasticus]|uniref:Uncharacterized protein n=1 Tax=Exophiala sideris TaxID=1016849 RepID=A0ABR0J6I2_9EURO|nr:hypothetical protein LTR10_021108 [Elasticomyces elasticus]KAK5028905.1 hypothetical protein LTS07_006286 [Exophiala sideris]KAK5035774.1 hypothetical protein LTR13_005905 [Exophiala sideris]KAK5057409.1 hypothetical protein LTR69_007450 [Exophiala sideris]KAK5181615.1 hypothetical protein LTR44_005814 [Eurotiomycetes sp. CCFEE 6388]